MELTLTEALRIKNEISTTIKTLQYKALTASFGVTLEDGEIISKDADLFENVESSLIRALGYSEEINYKLSKFNRESSVDNIIRKMQNSKLLLGIYNTSLPKTKPTKQKKFENLNTVRKSVEIEYKPSVSSRVIKEKISEHKGLIRSYQSEVEEINQNKISVNFTYADIESLIE